MLDFQRKVVPTINSSVRERGEENFGRLFWFNNERGGGT
jgi:hypothetical protein